MKDINPLTGKERTSVAIIVMHKETCKETIVYIEDADYSLDFLYETMPQEEKIVEVLGDGVEMKWQYEQDEFSKDGQKDWLALDDSGSEYSVIMRRIDENGDYV